jgi:LTXXQ motif family protein
MAANKGEGDNASRARQSRIVIRGAALFAILCAGGVLVSPTWAQTVASSPIDTLHRDLNLNAQQELAWKAYRDQASVPEKAQERRRAAAKMFPTLASPQRMDLIEAELRLELLDLQRQSRALKAFYVTLSPEQKRVFDFETLPPRESEQPSG